MDLNTIWFLLFGVLLIGYAILDGFDLGVGILHLFTRGERERRINLNAIGPVWDGNEVWLLTGGGALFAAFPVVYATVFSGFYLALMLLLVFLILRAVSLEFRSKVEAPGWRAAWDWCFGLGSLVPVLLFGVALGNILRGIPIDQAGNFTGTFLGLLNPYSLLVGLLSVAMLTMQGAAYLVIKTEGDQQAFVKAWLNRAWMAFVVLYLAATVATFFVSPSLFAGLLGNPIFWVLLVLLLGSLIYVPIGVKGGKPLVTFLATSAVVLCVVGYCGLSLYPRLVPSSLNPEWSLTIYNAASTPRTQTVMLVIALIGMPLVIAYTAFIYHAFKGKVVLGKDSY